MDVYEQASEAMILHMVKSEQKMSNMHIKRNVFSGKDLSGFSIFDVLFESSSLERTKLARSSHLNSNYMATDLKQAEIAFSDLETTNFENCQLIKTDFNNSRFIDCNFKECVTHSINFKNCHLANVTFTKCQMYSAKMNNATIMKCNFHPDRRADLTGMNNAVFRNALVVDTSFMWVDLTQTDFTGATLINCNFDAAALQQVDFSGATVINCSFRSSDTDDVVWSDKGLVMV